MEALRADRQGEEAGGADQEEPGGEAEEEMTADAVEGAADLQKPFSTFYRQLWMLWVPTRYCLPQDSGKTPFYPSRQKGGHFLTHN